MPALGQLTRGAKSRVPPSTWLSSQWHEQILCSRVAIRKLWKSRGAQDFVAEKSNVDREVKKILSPRGSPGTSISAVQNRNLTAVGETCPLGSFLGRALVRCAERAMPCFLVPEPFLRLVLTVNPEERGHVSLWDRKQASLLLPVPVPTPPPPAEISSCANPRTQRPSLLRLPGPGKLGGGGRRFSDSPSSSLRLTSIQP